MADDFEWAPVGIDTSQPSVARMYDYYLGGKDNFAIDRETAERALGVVPEAYHIVWDNRRFLQRAVRHLVGELGIRQIIDIGTGIPTAGPVHEIAHAVAPETRVVYVDNDPIVLAHARALLERGSPNVTVLRGDLRDPGALMGQPHVKDFLDFNQPVAVLLIAMLHFVTDADDPARIVQELMAPLPAGSYLAASHGTGELQDPADADRLQHVYSTATAPLVLRDRAAVTRLLADAALELLHPGMVWIQQWQDTDAPAPDPAHGWLIAGLARTTT